MPILYVTCSLARYISAGPQLLHVGRNCYTSGRFRGLVVRAEGLPVGRLVLGGPLINKFERYMALRGGGGRCRGRLVKVGSGKKQRKLWHCNGQNERKLGRSREFGRNGT